MTAKYYLDKPNSGNETAVYLFVRSGDNTLKFNTGDKIHPRYWSADKPDNHYRKFIGSPERNQWLINLRADVHTLYRSRHEWNLLDLKNGIKALVNRQKPKDSEKTFSEALTEFVNLREKDKEMAATTVKKYKTLKAHLLEFSKETETPLRFEGINVRFFDAFAAFLRNEKNHLNNTVNKYLKTLKTFINWAIDREYVKSEIVNTKYKISDDLNDVIYITDDELMQLYSWDFSKDPALAKIRDVFCFGCFTGQRFSDIRALRHGDIKLNRWHLYQLKGKETIINEIPLLDYALKILERYKNGVLPLPVISNQRTNDHLKKMCRIAGITEEIKIVRYQGNKQIIVREPKYNFIGTHTARRTFITLSLEKGMRPETVMAISGHKDYKSFKRYIAVTQKMKDKELSLSWARKNPQKIAKNA